MSRRTAAAAFITVAAMAVAGVAAAAPHARVQSPAAVTATRPARSAGLAAAQLPVMGYNTWYQYDRSVTEADVLTQARAMKSRGLQAAGYNLITLDDGWQGTTAAQRKAGVNLTWNRAEFPHGIPWLARQLHALGFKLGIYTAMGLVAVSSAVTAPPAALATISRTPACLPPGVFPSSRSMTAAAFRRAPRTRN